MAEATFFFDASLTLRKFSEDPFRLTLSPRPLSARDSTPLFDNSVPEFNKSCIALCLMTLEALISAFSVCPQERHKKQILAFAILGVNVMAMGTFLRGVVGCYFEDILAFVLCFVCGEGFEEMPAFV